MTHHAKYIQSVIDKSLNFIDSLSGLQEPDAIVPDYMTRGNHPLYDGIVFWQPIPANISQEQFKEYEEKIGFPLPETYKDFLSHKYYISLDFAHEAWFFRHTDSWAEDYYTIMKEEGFENNLERGLIPFANETDRGYFCFDTNRPAIHNEYHIVTYDRSFEEQEYVTKDGGTTFIDMVRELEQRLDEWIKFKQTES